MTKSSLISIWPSDSIATCFLTIICKKFLVSEGCRKTGFILKHFGGYCYNNSWTVLRRVWSSKSYPLFERQSSRSICQRLLSSNMRTLCSIWECSASSASTKQSYISLIRYYYADWASFLSSLEETYVIDA